MPPRVNLLVVSASRDRCAEPAAASLNIDLTGEFKSGKRCGTPSAGNATGIPYNAPPKNSSPSAIHVKLQIQIKINDFQGTCSLSTQRTLLTKFLEHSLLMFIMRSSEYS